MVVQAGLGFDVDTSTALYLIITVEVAAEVAAKGVAEIATEIAVKVTAEVLTEAASRLRYYSQI